MNGHDFNLNTLAKAIDGIGEIGKVNSLRENVGGSDDLMSAVNLAAWKNTKGPDEGNDWGFVQDIVSGKRRVRIDEDGSILGENYHGEYADDGTIYISRNLTGDRFDSAATILATLRHEGIHQDDPATMTDEYHYRAYWAEGESYNSSQMFYMMQEIMLDGKIGDYEHGVNMIGAAQRNFSEEQFRRLLDGIDFNENKNETYIVKERLKDSSQVIGTLSILNGISGFKKYMEKKEMSVAERAEWEQALKEMDDYYLKMLNPNTDASERNPLVQLDRFKSFMSKIRFSEYAERHLEVNNALMDLAFGVFTGGMAYSIEMEYNRIGNNNAFGNTIVEICDTYTDPYVDIGYSPASVLDEERMKSRAEGVTTIYETMRKAEGHDDMGVVGFVLMNNYTYFESLFGEFGGTIDDGPKTLAWAPREREISKGKIDRIEPDYGDMLLGRARPYLD